MQLRPIAFISSPYKQKFAIPRQSNLVAEAKGEIRFLEEFSDINSVRGLEQFSHLWLLFLFHESADQGWSATVSPPRLGGTERVGVFATRSMFRPNPIGLSVVKLEGIEQRGKQLVIHISGLDLLDGTPLYDIKPYLPYADTLPDAHAGFAGEAPGKVLDICFSETAEQALHDLATQHPDLRAFITAVLQQDPRPAQHVRKDSDKNFAMLLHDLNIRWYFRDGSCLVTAIEPAATFKSGAQR